MPAFRFVEGVVPPAEPERHVLADSFSLSVIYWDFHGKELILGRREEAHRGEAFLDAGRASHACRCLIFNEV